jgi:hypothetical protein
VVYTDDCLIFAKDNSTIDDLIKNLSQTYLMEDQGDVNDYLRVHICKDPLTKTISVTQTGLIESIIHDVGLSINSNGKTTPAECVLHPDTSGAP